MAEAMITDGRHAYRPQAIGRVFGWFFLATFLTSIPAYFLGYAKMLETPSLITGSGANPSTGIATGAMLEVFLLIPPTLASPWWRTRSSSGRARWERSATSQPVLLRRCSSPSGSSVPLRSC